MPFQAPDAGFAGIFPDDAQQGVFPERDAFFFQSVGFDLFRHQESLRDGQFLGFEITGQLEDLHAVVQRGGDGVRRIGRRQKQHAGQIVIHFEVVVVEGVVLFGIQHFQQGRRGVAAHVPPQLVHLVEQDHRIDGPGSAHRLDDPSRHGTDIGPAMASYLGLVVHAAQGHADEFPAHGVRDRTAEGRLAHARGTDQAQDRALQVPCQLDDRQVLEDMFLRFLQSVVIGVEHGLHTADILAVPRTFSPRHFDEPFEVVADHRRFGGGRMHLLEFFQFSHGLFVGFFGHLRIRYLLCQPAQVFRQFLQFTQFLLDHTHLFLEEELPLRLGDSVPDLAVEMVLDLQDLQFRRQDGRQLVELLDNRRRFDEPLLDLGALLDEGRHGISQALGVVHVLQ